jgi:peptidoglycan/xylan/chitin deacetylase (PgdA/CDA1 family)
VLDGTAILADIMGTPPAFFRPPHGAVRRAMVDTAAEQKQLLVLWSLCAHDWGRLGGSRRIAARLNRARSGQIVLMHDGRMQINRPDQLLAVLPQFINDNCGKWRYQELCTNASVGRKLTQAIRTI